MLRGRPFARRHGADRFGSLAPNQITSATKRFWHDAQDDATITVATGVSAWVDKFGNGYDVTQGTGSKQPTKSTAAFGGRQSLLFTLASSQELVFTHASKVNDFAGGTDTAYEWWMVLQFTSVAGSPVFAQVDSSTSATTYALHLLLGTAWNYERRDGVGADTLRVQSGNTPATATPYILRAKYTGTDATWTLNGTTLTTAGSSDTGAMALDRLIYGAFGNGAGAHTAFAGMYFAEGIGFTGGISAPEASGLTNHLKAKWGVAF